MVIFAIVMQILLKLVPWDLRLKLSLKEGLTDLVAWGDQQTAVSRIEDAHQELMAKGLVI